MTQKYYSVTTNNKFAGLNLDSDNEVDVLAEKPAHLLQAEAAADQAAASEASKKHDNRRGAAAKGANTDTRSPRKPRAAGGGAAKEDYDADATRDNRMRDKGTASNKVATANYKKFEGRREGQKKLDRRGGAPKPTDDVDPKHQEDDAAAAVVDAEQELKSEDVAVESPSHVEPEPEVKSVKQYLAETAGERYVIEEGSAVEKYDALEKEMVEAGFTAKGPKVVEDVHVSKSTKTIRKTAHKDAKELNDIVDVPKLQKKDRRDNGDRRTNNRGYPDNRKPAPTSEGVSPKAAEAEVKAKKKAYKDLTLFPGLE